MKRNLLLSLCLLSGLSFSLQAQSNLFIDQSYTVEEMVMDFFDNPDITVSNVTASTDTYSIAFFDAGGTDLALDAGIVFCNGNVEDVVGPNVSGAVSSGLGLPGDADIDAMGGSISNDAVIIEFDFTVNVSDILDFNYVFGSEEYPEFVNTMFNDAFGFFISGPGISGPFSNGAENYALIPNTNDEVAINSVNAGTNSQYFVDNMGGLHMEYDGFTTLLPASFIAVGGETYHVKIVVADRADSALDSGIFLSFNSLGQDSLLVPPTSFQMVQNSNTIEFTNESKYARSWYWDFGNGDFSDERNPGPVTYDTPGTYTVSLTTQNYCCSETFTSTVVISVLPISVTATTINNPLNCFGDQNASIQVEVSGGLEPYTISPDPAALQNIGAGLYSITITDAEGATSSIDIVITEPAEITLTTSSTYEVDSLSDGTATVVPLSGIAPFTFLWSNGATEQTAENLSTGDYSVTVTDANGCVQMTTVFVEHILTGLQHDNNDFSFKLFPNPVKDQLFINWSETSAIKELVVFDVLGQQVSVSFDLSGNRIAVRFDRTLPAGVYHLQLTLTDGLSGVERFIAE